MAQRIVRQLRDLFGEVHQRPSVADLGIWVGREPPPEAQRITFEQWLAGVPGYWGFLNLNGTLVVLAGGARMELTGAIPAVQVARWLWSVVMPSGAVMELRGAVPTVSIVQPGIQLPGGAAMALTGAVPGVAVMNKVVPMVAGAAMALTGAVPTVTKVSQFIVNGGFESALGAEWATSGSNQATQTRVGVDGSVSPRAGSYQIKLYAQDTTAGGTSFVKQTISGASYRAASGTLAVALASPVSVLTSDSNAKIFVVVLALNASSALLGRTDFILAGAYAGTPSGQEDTTYRAALTANTYLDYSIALRTSLDAKIGGGNLASVDHVDFYFRVDCPTGQNRTAYYDALAFT